MIDVSAPVLLIAAGAFALGVVIQGSIGFGSNLIAAPVLFLLDPDLLPGPLLTAGVVVAAMFSGRERHHGSWPEVVTVMIGRVPGSAVGVAVLAVLPLTGVGILFGVLLLGAVGLSISGWRLVPTRPTLLSAGFVSGITATVIAVGGPPVAVVYQSSAGPDVRSNMSRVLFLGTLASVAALAIGGRYDLGDLLAGIALLPAGVVGYVLSSRTASVVDRGYTRPAVLAVSAASGIAVIIRSLV